MSYEVFIKCDLVDCGARVPVPNEGMIPIGWVAVKAVKVNLMAGPRSNLPVEQTYVFCGPRCVIKHFKAQLAGD